jgi:predicted enzyme related to lactoylglutathione lyase
MFEMHQSRLSGFIIDCNTEDLEGAASFWGAALGLRVEASAEAGEALYRRLEGLQLDIEVQKVTHPSRVHLDIESTDVEAEVRRLEKLGARRVSAVRDWQVMEAPTGQRFCVVPARKSSTAGNYWND